MSRKTTPSDNFLPSKGIREDVLDHQLSSIFGSRAAYRRSTRREGWVISNGNKATKDRIKQLQSLTELVNATREREAVERQRKERPRQELLVGNTGASVLPDSERVSQEAFARERVEARHQQDYPDTRIPHRTASLASRYPPERHDSYQEANLRASNLAPYVQPRNDGYSPRTSSLQVNNTAPIQIPSNPNRHHKSPGYGKGSNDVGPLQDGSFSQGPAFAHHGNHGNQDPSVAARDLSRKYEEEEFRDFLDWQQYKKLRRQAAEVLHQRRRRRSEDSSSDSDMAAMLSSVALRPITASKPSHRHIDKTSREGMGTSQNIRANPKIEPAKKEQARSTRRMRDVEEDSESDSEDRDRDSSPEPDGVIGHRHQAPKAGPGENPLVKPLEYVLNASDTRTRLPTNPSNERHQVIRPDPRHDSIETSRDLSTSTRQGSGYGAEARSRVVQNYALAPSKASARSKGTYDDEDASRRRSQRGESFYDDEQKKEKRHADREAPYVTPNSGRRLDRGERGYVPSSDRSY